MDREPDISRADYDREEARTLEAKAEADAGRGVLHEQVVAGMKSWRTRDEMRDRSRIASGNLARCRAGRA